MFKPKQPNLSGVLRARQSAKKTTDGMRSYKNGDYTWGSEQKNVPNCHGVTIFRGWWDYIGNVWCKTEISGENWERHMSKDGQPVANKRRKRNSWLEARNRFSLCEEKRTMSWCISAQSCFNAAISRNPSNLKSTDFLLWNLSSSETGQWLLEPILYWYPSAFKSDKPFF